MTKEPQLHASRSELWPVLVETSWLTPAAIINTLLALMPVHPSVYIAVCVSPAAHCSPLDYFLKVPPLLGPDGLYTGSQPTVLPRRGRRPAADVDAVPHVLVLRR